MSFTITATSTYLAYYKDLNAPTRKGDDTTANKANAMQNTSLQAGNINLDNNVIQNKPTTPEATTNSSSTENTTTKPYDNAMPVITGEAQITSMPNINGSGKSEKSDRQSNEKSGDKAGNDKSNTSTNLTPEEQKQVDELKKRDAEVKSHEQAHLSAGGSYVRGGASYTYQTGADGVKYAVGGEVQIDTSPVKDNPEATIQKAQIIRSAALAPAEPSSQDKAVAAQASKMMQEAQAELMQKNQEGAKGNNKSNNIGSATQSDKSDKQSNNQLQSSLLGIYQQDGEDDRGKSLQINLVA